MFCHLLTLSLHSGIYNRNSLSSLTFVKWTVTWILSNTSSSLLLVLCLWPKFISPTRPLQLISNCANMKFRKYSTKMRNYGIQLGNCWPVLRAKDCGELCLAAANFIGRRIREVSRQWLAICFLTRPLNKTQTDIIVHRAWWWTDFNAAWRSTASQCAQVK